MPALLLHCCLPAPLRLLQVTCVCVLALLFRLMARTADDFFACILSQISQVGLLSYSWGLAWPGLANVCV